MDASRATSGITRVKAKRFPMSNGRLSPDDPGVAKQERLWTYDDELHERRRRLSVVREPINFEAERLKRLIERSRRTQDP